MENQVSMHIHHLEVGEEERLLWERLEGFRDPWMEMILTLNQLKVIASSLPFLNHNDRLRSAFKEALRSMTSRARRWVTHFLELLPRLGSSTHKNVERVVEAWASMILKEVYP